MPHRTSAQVPILKQGPFLLASVQSELSDADFVQFRESIMAKVRHWRSRGVIIDVTAIEVLDSFACRTLRDVALMLSFQGAETVVVGIQPEVAFSMVQLGATLGGVATALDLEEGIEYLQSQGNHQD